MDIFFSDLDGTLLDHNTYSYDKAKRGIAILKKYSVPLVLVSSKTFSEMKELHREMDLLSPFIFENGGGTAFPQKDTDDYKIEISGMGTSELEKKFLLLKNYISIPVKTLLQMDPEEIAERTGLPLSRAKLARERKASLPFILLNNKTIEAGELQGLSKIMELHKITLTRGGRFYHFSSLNANKGYATKKLLYYYQHKTKDTSIRSIAIGDSENDLPMLQIADLPFLVKKHNGSSIKTDIKNIIITEGIGPAGFTEAVESIWT